MQDNAGTTRHSYTYLWEMLSIQMLMQAQMGSPTFIHPFMARALTVAVTTIVSCGCNVFISMLKAQIDQSMQGEIVTWDYRNNRVRLFYSPKNMTVVKIPARG